MRVIKDGEIIEDCWRLVEEDDGLDEGDCILPFSRWLAEREQLKSHPGRIAVWIDGSVDLECLVPHLEELELIAIHFPSFRDGRGYSLARLLRERHGYRGELRAVGDVLRDQLYPMQRCGINSFALREDQDPEHALKGLKGFSVKYQAAVDGEGPLYRQR